MLLLSNKDQQQ